MQQRQPTIPKVNLRGLRITSGTSGRYRSPDNIFLTCPSLQECYELNSDGGLEI